MGIENFLESGGGNWGDKFSKTQSGLGWGALGWVGMSLGWVCIGNGLGLG